MFVAYVFTKQNYCRLKLITKKELEAFTVSGDVTEYKINKKRIYRKKFLFLFPFFFSVYRQGDPDPVDIHGENVSHETTYINEVSQVLRNIKYGMLENINLVASIIAAGGAVGACVMLAQIGQHMGLW